MAKRKKAKPTKKKKTAISVPASVIELGDRRELFVDDYLIERLFNVELRLQKPVPRNVAIDHDVPWEGNTSAYHTVFQDGKLFRAYYRGSHYDPSGNHYRPVVCYAESRDGIEWYRPELGLVNYQGSTRNNIVWDGIGAHNFAPFRDRNPDCREGEEYKALGSALARTTEEQALYAFKSADGVHWSLLSEKPVITVGAFDSLNLAFFDPLRGCYVDYHRDSIYPGGETGAQHHDLHLERLPPLDEAAVARLRRRARRASLHQRGDSPTIGPRTSTWASPSVSCRIAACPATPPAACRTPCT